VSSERVIIVSGSSPRAVWSLNLNTLTDIMLTERADGSGTITFGPLPPWYGWYAGQQWLGSGCPGSRQLDLAGDVRHVYEVILSAQWVLKQGI
jgi:hypothetical protein